MATKKKQRARKRKALTGRVALVAGATRGAGRAIAVKLGEAGATVWCTGRSTRGRSAMKGRPECIEDTAELVNAAGGKGIAVQTDHTDERQVQSLFKRIQKRSGRLDVLVNDVWGGDDMMDWAHPFWEQPPGRFQALVERAIYTHVITARHAAALMVRRKRGLIIEVTDGDSLHYRMSLAYDLVKTAVMRLAYGMAEELFPHGVTALAVTPGFLRSEAMLDHFGVTEENWRVGVKNDEHFIASETPAFVGAAVAALAMDTNVHAKTGGVYASWTLADEYGFTDADGRTPHWGRYCKKRFGGNPLGPPKTGLLWSIKPVPRSRKKPRA